MHQNTPTWSSFKRKWPLSRLCISAVFVGSVAWAVVVNHPVKWFAFTAVPLVAVLVKDVWTVLRAP